ncbi:MAG: hypothetical protein IJK30_13315 [Ruminococcus sp.]|nr:hypothetical protein [Ruminococcus sp.]
MAIRKDLDDMLNSLMDGGGSSSTPARSHTTPRAVRKSRFDNMSVDDLLHALEEEKHHIEDEQPVIPDNTPPASWEFAPPTHEFAPSPESIVPEESPAEEVPNIIAEVMHTEPTAEMTRVFDTVPVSEELPKPAKKKKIVITGELPDYEALRRQEFEREQQAQRAAEAAAEEARAAERARRAAEAAAERQRLAEEAERRRLAQEEAERQRRLAEEAEQARLAEEAEKRRLAQEEAERQRRLAEEAEQARLAEEAEKRRLAQEEAERQRRLAEEAEQARLAEEAEKRRLAEEEAERQRRIEEMKRLAEAAEEKAPAPVTFAEETIVNSSSAEEAVDAAIEALGEAAAAPAEEMAEAAAETAKPKKISLFKKLKNKGKDEFKPDTEAAPEDGLFEPAEEPSATDLIDAAIAAIHDEEVSHESDPVGSMLENIREDAAEAIADMNEAKSEEPENTSDQPLIMSDEDIISGLTPDLKERFDALPADKQQQVIEMRRAQMGAIAPPIVMDEPEEDILPDEDIAPEEPETAEKAEETAPEKPEDEEKPAEAAPVKEEKPKGKVTSALERILDEDPDELIAQRRENVESSSDEPAKDPNRKKLLYTILGVVMTAFAIIGIIATVFKGIGLARSFTSGEVKKDSFTQMVYPAVIMDIEPFSDPSQLTSEQIVTATIWSIIMDDSKISKYDATLDTVTIPDVDVEKYAVELFGENIPQFNHCTVGPVESRFYYSDGAYNVKVKPITHTYAPEVKSIVKNGSEYTLTVDYIAELPTWMEKTVAKQAEYKLTEKEDGTFRFNSMKIISVNSGNI